jgi:hypothetical protein
MEQAVEFAEKHGFEIGRTKASHLMFRGFGGIVIGAGTPGKGSGGQTFANQRSISRMRALMRAHAAGESLPPSEEDLMAEPVRPSQQERQRKRG